MLGRLAVQAGVGHTGGVVEGRTRGADSPARNPAPRGDGIGTASLGASCRRKQDWFRFYRGLAVQGGDRRFVRRFRYIAPGLEDSRINPYRLHATVRSCVGNAGIAGLSDHFDLAFSNPPYVPLGDAASLQRELRHEASVGQYGGEVRVRVIERLALNAPRIVRPGEWPLAGIGYRPSPAVENMLDRPERAAQPFARDIAGIDRIVVVKRSGAPNADPWPRRHLRARKSVRKIPQDSWLRSGNRLNRFLIPSSCWRVKANSSRRCACHPRECREKTPP